MKQLTISFLAGALLAGTASAQMTEDVKFSAGNYGTMISGEITGKQYYDYKLEAAGGQELFYELSVTGGNGNGTAHLNLLPPGSNDVAIYVGSMDEDRTETIQLPEDGVYTLRVYLMGNDSDTDKTVQYNLDLSVQ